MSVIKVDYGEVSGVEEYELGWVADTFSARVPPTIPTTKKARGLIFAYSYNNNIYFIKAMDGKDGNCAFWNNVIDTSYVITFNDNSIVFSKYISDVNIPYKGYIIY